MSESRAAGSGPRPWVYAVVAALALVFVGLLVAAALGFGQPGQGPLAAGGSPTPLASLAVTATPSPSIAPLPSPLASPAASIGPSIEPTVLATVAPTTLVTARPATPRPTRTATASTAPSQVAGPHIASFVGSGPVICIAGDPSVKYPAIAWTVTGATGVNIGIDGPQQYNTLPFATSYIANANGAEELPFSCGSDHHTYTLTTIGGVGPAATQTITIFRVMPPP